jgi:hypothetical protein
VTEGGVAAVAFECEFVIAAVGQATVGFGERFQQQKACVGVFDIDEVAPEDVILAGEGRDLASPGFGEKEGRASSGIGFFYEMAGVAAATVLVDGPAKQRVERGGIAVARIGHFVPSGYVSDCFARISAVAAGEISALFWRWVRTGHFGASLALRFVADPLEKSTMLFFHKFGAHDLGGCVGSADPAEQDTAFGIVEIDEAGLLQARHGFARCISGKTLEIDPARMARIAGGWAVGPEEWSDAAFVKCSWGFFAGG